VKQTQLQMETGDYDGTITNWRMPMSGMMNTNNASFTIRYKVRVK
jgi:hypothetical protein